MNNIILYENITDAELKEIFSQVKHSKQRLDYIRRYYTDRKDSYVILEYTSTDNKLSGEIEIYKNRVINRHEIDAALFFVNKGFSVTLLPEGEAEKERNIDAIFNHKTLVEFKRVKSENPNTIANEIKDAANKGNSEVITVFFTEKAINIDYERILDMIAFKKGKGHFTGIYDELLFIRNEIITRIYKKIRYAQPKLIPTAFKIYSALIELSTFFKKCVIMASNDGIREAGEILMEISESLREWSKKEMRFKAEADRLAALDASHDKGLEEGIVQGKMEDARGMKAENIPVETIVKITGLTTEQVEAL